MKCVSCCVVAVALVAPQFAVAQSAVPDSPLGCPPGRTLTIPPSEDAELVLAGGPQLTSEQVAGPFDSPRSVGFLPDGWFLVAEKQGRLLLVRPDGEGVPISGAPDVLTEGHGGFIDLAVDPNYAVNDTIYLSYLVGTADSSTIRVMKAKLDDQNEALTDQQILFESTPGAKPEQLGGRIALTPDGYLFLSLGDRWAGDLAQDLTQDEGTIIRIRTDGSIPADNPFRWLLGARPEIWSYGHRNPQGLAFDVTRKELWSDEHGPQGGDELNLILPGHDYGWPVITYGTDYSGRPIGNGVAQTGLEQPVHYWVPTSIAPSGLALESDPSHRIVWMSTLAAETLVRLTFGDGCTFSEDHFLEHRLGRLRDVRIDPSGVLYVLTDGPEGMLYRLDRGTEDNGEKTRL
ncbi:MAG: PQQ-dependent sugar dehydrogenase [Methyloceanibacter sp.]|jgi:glucose/arabinose dehydrogenase